MGAVTALNNLYQLCFRKLIQQPGNEEHSETFTLDLAISYLIVVLQ